MPIWTKLIEEQQQTINNMLNKKANEPVDEVKETDVTRTKKNLILANTHTYEKMMGGENLSTTKCIENAEALLLELAKLETEMMNRYPDVKNTLRHVLMVSVNKLLQNAINASKDENDQVKIVTFQKKFQYIWNSQYSNTKIEFPESANKDKLQQYDKLQKLENFARSCGQLTHQAIKIKQEASLMASRKYSPRLQ